MLNTSSQRALIRNWKRHFSASLLLVLCYTALLGIQAIHQYASIKIQEAANKLGEHTLLLNSFGPPLSPPESREIIHYLHRQLAQAGLYPLRIKHQHGPDGLVTLMISHEDSLTALKLLKANRQLPRERYAFALSQHNKSQQLLGKRYYQSLDFLELPEEPLKQWLQVQDNLSWLKQPSWQAHRWTHLLIQNSQGASRRVIEKKLHDIAPRQYWQIQDPLKLLSQSLKLSQQLEQLLTWIYRFSLLLGLLTTLYLTYVSLKDRRQEIALRLLAGAKRHQLITYLIQETLILSSSAWGIAILLTESLAWLMGNMSPTWSNHLSILLLASISNAAFAYHLIMRFTNERLLTLSHH